MKKNSYLIFCVSCLLFPIYFACDKNEYKDLDCSNEQASFTSEIQPIIQSNCMSSGCHELNSKNGDFSAYTEIKGKANNGSLKKRVLIEKDMPPSNALTLAERKKIKCWLDNGAQNN